ncbi:MFS transporter [Streptacidiphilus sp. N1-12]|uniref:MFS transporter n=2 Tax=Streptacidiphilus alkalitolerans TaxID=3342712 RepID=A0ABV6V3L2_9ACTN
MTIEAAAEPDADTGPDPRPQADGEAAARKVRTRAALIAAAVSVLLVVAIVLGSRGLRDFDSALIPYTVATIFLTFGVVYRYLVWISAPAAWRLFRKGLGTLFSWQNFRRAPTALPRMAATYLGFQRFLGARSHSRWIAHQAMFWGCLLAVAITFPLTWGWFTFTASSATGPGYEMRVWGFKVLGFSSSSLFGWAMYHGLDLAAVLVIGGVGYFLWRRTRDRAATTGQRFGYDFLPLLALLTISVTGLLLTFSEICLHGGGYEFLAVLHMVSVVFTLVYLPFGKFFHIVQRPAAVGMQLFKYSTRTGAAAGLGAGAAAGQPGAEPAELFACRRCGEPVDTAPYVENLRGTMRDLKLGFDEWAEYCPRCKRVLRGSAYLQHVKRGFK